MWSRLYTGSVYREAYTEIYADFVLRTRVHLFYKKQGCNTGHHGKRVHATYQE